jgi:hypothetical protein
MITVRLLFAYNDLDEGLRNSVTRQAQEIDIRMTHGANKRQIFRMTVRQATMFRRAETCRPIL